MFLQNINPDIISLGPFSVRFYGIVYALGFLLVNYLLIKKAGKIKNLTKERASDLVIYIMLFGILGARIVHVLTEWDYYSLNLSEIFAVWKGGLAFHGGLIGGTLAAYFFTKKHKISFLEIMDFIVVPLSIVTAFGRIANFINSEHIGQPSSLPWCVVFLMVDEVCRHPVQIYEAITQFLLFGMMLYFGQQKLKSGKLTLIYLFSYSLFRFMTDFFRSTYTVFFFGLAISQLVSIVIMGVSAYFYLSSKK